MLTDAELVRAAISDADDLQRLCRWIGSKPNPTHADRDLLKRATAILTTWQDWDDATQ
jgi:hypothetical protein